MKSRNSCLSWSLLLAMLFLISLVALAVYIPQAVQRSFGPPSPNLNLWLRFYYGTELTWNAGDLTQPRDPGGADQVFIIQPGESVVSISERLEQAGLIRSADTFRTYLLWTGLDTVIQNGTYRLSPAKTGLEIAGLLKSFSLTEVNFRVLPGWRMEEIAASLPTSGLEFTPEAFLEVATAPANALNLIPAGATAEGFLFPDSYILPRTISAEALVTILIERFSTNISAEINAAYLNRGLTVFQAVTMASIIQREVMVDDEMPLIASVFYNRLAIGMPLQTDPTVQYALGFNTLQGTWWTNPLSGEDLRFDSLFNTYLYPGLPPAPISNPGLPALLAVAYPAASDYYYFQAKCDGSGWHNFAVTLEQHLQNNCP